MIPGHVDPTHFDAAAQEAANGTGRPQNLVWDQFDNLRLVDDAELPRLPGYRLHSRYEPTTMPRA